MALLDAHFATKPASEWVRQINEHDLIAAPVQNYDEVVADPQVVANDYIVEVERPGHEPVRMVGVPVELSKTPGSVRSLAPALGEHTVEVLLEHGYSAEEVSELTEEGVVAVLADEKGPAKQR
jgi:CoA:oxalate CoA-transferase